MLDTLGIGAVAQVIYTAMQDHPVAGVAELVALVDISEQEVRAALDELVSLELLRHSREPGRCFSPVPLAIALPALMRR
ncbi:MAG: helix-turn-helix transcriptional regulator, partial [Streptomyces sp.]|nr:helix-turn-helix transcriptional regulator [Streptomyces sp.]